jgi:SSS family solute:Na+ symporter
MAGKACTTSSLSLCRFLWGSQSWLQPAFSRLFAGGTACPTFSDTPEMSKLQQPAFSRLFGLPLLLATILQAGEFPRALDAYRGKTPKVDGIVSPGEYSDATAFTGVSDWIPQFTRTTNPRDLALRGWVKHDGSRLYFAFEVTDDVLYGIDTPRWLPDNNLKAHELTGEGYPWFGDEMELLINASNRWRGDESAAGNGSSWQMVCNLTKSRKGGVGKGGLLEGEPRKDINAWNTYRSWIDSGAQQCEAKRTSGGYVMEWSAAFNPCLEVEPGRFYTPSMGDRKVGLNIALGDLDEKEKGAGNFGNFHHEDWWAGARDVRTQLKQWGTLAIRTGKKP